MSLLFGDSLASARAIRHGPGMQSSLTNTLCTRCGLCCDGSLFAEVELAGPAEAAGLEVMGLEIEDEDDEARGGLLVQPCRALQGKRCGIYAHRPECCQTFECRLLQETRQGVVSVAQAAKHITEALRHVGRVRELAAELGQPDGRLPLKELCIEALAMSGGATKDRALSRHRALLEAEMAFVEQMIQQRFLRAGERMSN